MSAQPATAAEPTIVAIATAAGMGGVGIVRVSGSAAGAIAKQIFPKPLPSRQLIFGEFLDVQGDAIDEGMAVLFPGPNSFTGEDVLELQGHGGPVVLRLLVEACMAHGAQLAAPGEFSQRAFVNGKLDLAQAEAVADLIASGSDQAARSALRSLQGVFSSQVNEVSAGLRNLRLFVEATLDFPDEEEVDRGAEFGLTERLVEMLEQLNLLLQNTRSAARFTEGITVALVGEPNAGKSSLLNALSGEDRAIVTPIPGTTRDLLPVDLVLDGLPVRLVDTAGLRKTVDAVEQEGVKRAIAQAQQADVVVWLIDGATAELDRFMAGTVKTKRSVYKNIEAMFEVTPDPERLVIALSKIDLLVAPTSGANDKKGPLETAQQQCQQANIVPTSATTGHGLDALVQQIKDKVGIRTDAAANTYTARQRHVLALEATQAALQQAQELAEHQADGGVLLAEELRLAHLSLGTIVGHTTPEDLLGDIFSQFCIGK